MYLYVNFQNPNEEEKRFLPSYRWFPVYESSIVALGLCCRFLQNTCADFSPV